MVRRLLVAYVLVLAGALLWGRVEAATVPARLPVNVAYNAGAYTVNGAAAAGAVGAASTVSVSGAIASIPVSYRLGELAGLAARTAIRGNAISLGVQVVADYLLPYGIKKCQDSGWCSGGTPEVAPNGKPYPAAGGYWQTGSTPAYYGGTPEDACSAFAVGNNYAATGVVLGSVTPNGGSRICHWLRNGSDVGSTAVLPAAGCAPGATLSNGQCIPAGYVPALPTGPAGDSDWSKVPTNLPDTVLTAVMQEGRVWLPAVPEVSTQVQTVPLSATYKDPTTGESYRDYAYVTGNPTDPQTATLQIVKTKVDPATGNPVVDPNTGNTTGTVKPEDPCAANPNRVGCMDKGDIPADPDLLKSEKTITITPDTGWGADTAACPADIVVPMRTRGAQTAVFSYQPVCKAADMFRPVVLGLAWVAAVLIALGVGRRGD